MKVRELLERLCQEGYADDQYWIGDDETWNRRDECHCLRIGPRVWKSFYSERGQANSMEQFDNEDAAADAFYRVLQRYGPRLRCIASLTDQGRAQQLLRALREAHVDATIDSSVTRNFSRPKYRILVPGVDFRKALDVRALIPSGWIPRGWGGEA